MLITENIIKYYFIKYDNVRREVHIVITDKCNIMCEHCNMGSGPDKDTLISDEYIDKVFETIDENWAVSIFGGEPMLYPEKALRIADNCRKKNIIFQMFTNGFWGNDEKLTDFVKNKIRPNILTMSISEFHKIDVSNYEKIFENFKDVEDIYLMYNTINNREGNFLESLYNKGLRGMHDLLTETGRSKEEEPDFNFVKICCARGLDVRPNGEIHALCENHSGCILGHIEKDSLTDLRAKYLKVPWWTTVESLFTACKGNALLDDERWPTMSEEYYNQFRQEIEIYRMRKGSPFDLETFNF